MRALSIVAILLCVGCASTPARVVTPTPPQPPKRLTKLVITADVNDDVRVCFEVTGWMRQEAPFVESGPFPQVCVETVGAMRQRVLRMRSAN
jgi:hypothetical protein